MKRRGESSRSAPGCSVERRRQHVLPGVLLHVIEAPRPVDDAVDASGPATWARLHHVHMRPSPSSIDDIDDADVAERPGIERLPAGRRIEGGAVEDDRRPCPLGVVDADDLASNSRR